MQDPVIVRPIEKHTATIIFLHGLGDTGDGWANTIASIRPPYAKVICPTASAMPVTLNSGFRMPSWFDLYSLDENGPEDSEGILAATNLCNKLIDDEVKQSGVAASRVVLGGFSQGGALALHAALVCAPRLAGAAALSCWLPRHAAFPRALPPDRAHLPVFLAHGDCDPVVPFKWGQMSGTFLKSFMTDVEFKSYPGLTHGPSEPELNDMKTFLHRVLPRI